MRLDRHNKLSSVYDDIAQPQLELFHDRRQTGGWRGAAHGTRHTELEFDILTTRMQYRYTIPFVFSVRILSVCGKDTKLSSYSRRNTCFSHHRYTVRIWFFIANYSNMTFWRNFWDKALIPPFPCSEHEPMSFILDQNLRFSWAPECQQVCGISSSTAIILVGVTSMEAPICQQAN